jgi:hypothetical protein
MRHLIIGLTALTLAACGQPAEQGGADGMGRISPVTMFSASPGLLPSRDAKGGEAEEIATAAAASSDAAAAGPAAPSEPGVTVPAGAPMLAYRYGYGIETPANRVRGLMGQHESACAAAGPGQCQVVSSSVREYGEDRLRANLSFRATPTWLKGFRDGLEGETKAAGGRVTKAEVDSEDLSRQIVDTEARLRAMTTLRDRLQNLLATRPGKLSDLVEIERELARVQGDIDSTQSQLAVMRGRVAMSEVTVEYESIGTLAPQGVLSPLLQAVTDFLGIVVYTLAAMIRLIAWLGPWVLAGAGLWWLLRKRLPKLRWPFGRKTSVDS